MWTLATIMTALALAIIRPERVARRRLIALGLFAGAGACLLLGTCAPITVITGRRASRSAITRSARSC